MTVMVALPRGVNVGGTGGPVGRQPRPVDHGNASWRTVTTLLGTAERIEA